MIFQRVFLYLRLLIKHKERGLIIIIGKNYCIYIERAFFKGFLVLTNVNMENGAGENKHWAI